MSKKANPTLIGGFVLGASVLLVIGVIVFGSGQYFQPRLTYVAFFKGSVKGLQVGAPVSFRGVNVGTVKEIVAVYDRETAEMNVAVIFELIDDASKTVIDIGSKQGRYAELEGHELVDFLIRERGLRAKLGMQSPITGQLYIQMEFHPDSPSELVDMETPYTQFPTVESGLKRMLRTLEELPLEEIANKVISTLDSIERLAGAPEVQSILRNTDGATGEAQHLMQRVNNRIEPLMAELQGAAEAARRAMRQAEITLALEEGVPGELAANVNETARAATGAFEEARRTLAKAQTTLNLVNGILDESSPFRRDVQVLVHELGAAARSFRALADYLERHPEALLKGKSQY